jgi:hypothetical protein
LHFENNAQVGADLALEYYKQMEQYRLEHPRQDKRENQMEMISVPRNYREPIPRHAKERRSFNSNNDRREDGEEGGERRHITRKFHRIMVRNVPTQVSWQDLKGFAIQQEDKKVQPFKIT